MSLPAQTPSQAFIALAAQAVFTWAFRIDDLATLSVTKNGTPLVLGVDFTVTAAPSYATGGTLTLVMPCAGGENVIISRVTPEKQSLSLSAYRAFPSTSIEAALDTLWMRIQELDVQIGKVVTQQVNIAGMAFKKWHINGDGVNANFALAGAVLTASTAFFVVVDGVLQNDDGTSYTVTAGNIAFTFIPVAGANIDIRSLAFSFS
jgi:hypothetical protein